MQFDVKTEKSPACCRCGRVWNGETEYAVAEFILADGSSFAGCTDCLAEWEQNSNVDFNEFWLLPQDDCAACKIDFDEVYNAD